MKTPTLKTLIIIPAYFEEATIAEVIASLKKASASVDIVVVNDGSGDKTGDIARSTGVKVLEHPFNMGIGATMQTGYKYAYKNDYDIAVQFDGDGQHPADQIEELIEPVKNGEADIVVGSRFLGIGDYRPSITRSAGMALFSNLVSRILSEKVTDTTSGFRAVNRAIIKYYCRNYPDDYPEVEAIVLLHKKGFKIREIPVKMVERAGGKSSITPSRSVYYMIKVMLAIFVDFLRRPDK